MPGDQNFGRNYSPNSKKFPSISQLKAIVQKNEQSKNQKSPFGSSLGKSPPDHQKQYQSQKALPRIKYQHNDNDLLPELKVNFRPKVHNKKANDISGRNRLHLLDAYSSKKDSQ